MAGEVQHKKVSRVVTEEARAAVAAADQVSTQTLAVKIPMTLPKWVWPALVSLFAGGGIGSGAINIIKDTTPVHVVAVTKQDAEKIAQDQVKAEIDKHADKQRVELRESISALHRRLDSIDNKLDNSSEQLRDIRLDILRAKSN